MKYLEQETTNNSMVDCDDDPITSLVSMFVDMVQKGRVERGQCPALRPVFVKPHGIAQGLFRINKDLPKDLKVGLFAGKEYPFWARFSSDTLPTIGDYKTTLGIALKLFDTPTPKIFGQADDTTFDFILQNMDIFFVDTAKDMCEFTKAGVVDHDYEHYFKKHPKTKKILDEMAKPVASVLASPYWGILPFSFGQERYVKYKLEPTLELKPPSSAPSDPTYLAVDLLERLKQNKTVFRFCIQLRTTPDTMPLDRAMVRWSEQESPFVHIADVIFPQQDIEARNQAYYGDNLSWNIWRVTEDHQPQGSIADARKAVYAASAQERRNVNGITDGEPVHNKPIPEVPACKDDVIVRASIHPGIGITRLGDAESEFFIGPEVTEPPSGQSGFYRTSEGSMKRQAARFRLYGYNAAGEIVRELTASNADITWTGHIANRKADWFQFITAMDIPETADLTLIRRNASINQDARNSLIIDPGPRSIRGISGAGGEEHRFDSGEFKGIKVYLGELQTDEQGRLLVLGGHGKSESPSSAPPFDPEDPDSFNNANDWFDDIADGPISAKVAFGGRQIPVESAWVVSTPPNYAPDIIGWRTLYDMLVDVYIGCGWIQVPETTSFSTDVLPQLKRLANLQWVNKGFVAMFGKGSPMDFNNPKFITQLSTSPDSETDDSFQELRQQLLNAFRPFNPEVNEPRIWPWVYGDSFGGGLFASSPRTMLALPAMQQIHLERWAKGQFIDDHNPNDKSPNQLSDVPLAEQPAMLDKAALHFCLADAFHPGCEMTWPMRHASLYIKPFRIRESNGAKVLDDYGKTINQQQILALNGPLHEQQAGDISRWMGLPWQGDTAYCRSGYDIDYDPYLPTFWPARVPNTVLTEEDYKIVIDPAQSQQKKLAAYSRRASWFRFIDQAPTISARMERMIAQFGAQGIIEERPGLIDDPDIPATLYVENITEDQRQAFMAVTKLFLEQPPVGARQKQLHKAGWIDEQHLQDAINLRARKKS